MCNGNWNGDHSIEGGQKDVSSLEGYTLTSNYILHGMAEF